MAGSATFTIVASSTIISWPRHRMASAIQRRRSEAAASSWFFDWLSRAFMGFLQGCGEHTIAIIIHITRMIYEKLTIADNMMIGALMMYRLPNMAERNCAPGSAVLLSRLA